MVPAGEKWIPGALPRALGLIGWNVHLQTTGFIGSVSTLISQQQAGSDTGAAAIKPAPAASPGGAGRAGGRAGAGFLAVLEMLSTHSFPPSVLGLSSSKLRLCAVSVHNRR